MSFFASLSECINRVTDISASAPSASGEGSVFSGWDSVKGMPPTGPSAMLVA
jgi:hypothetical protein